jgi:hypothetical protein
MKPKISSTNSSGNNGQARQLLYKAALFTSLIIAGVLAAFMLSMWHIGIDGGRPFKDRENAEASIRALRIAIIGFSVASSIGCICVLKIIESYFGKK